MEIQIYFQIAGIIYFIPYYILNEEYEKIYSLEQEKVLINQQNIQKKIIQIPYVSEIMRIIALYLMKYNGENPFFISSHFELSFLNWFQRPFFKETLNFGARTCASRAKPGDRAAVALQDAHAISYICIDKNNLAAIVIADDQYPEKVAFMVIQNMYQEFYKQYNSMFLDTITNDQNLNIPKLEEFIKIYQDPKEVDKLLKIENTLNEVTLIVHKSLDDLLKRGETLESLMAKSKDMSTVSLDFYKNAKKTNQKCCSLY